MQITNDSSLDERLLEPDQDALAEVEALALEGLESGDAEDEGPVYWAELHRGLITNTCSVDAALAEGGNEVELSSQHRIAYEPKLRLGESLDSLPKVSLPRKYTRDEMNER